MSSKTTYSLSINLDLKERLRAVSKKTDIPMARIIEMILEESLPEYEKKYMIQPRLKGG